MLNVVYMSLNFPLKPSPSCQVFVFFLFWGIIMHKENFLVHKSLWASVIIFLEKKNSRDGIAMSKRMDIFKAFDIYCQLAVRKSCANLFFLHHSIFYFYEDDRAIIGGQIRTGLSRSALTSVCAVDHGHHRQGDRRQITQGKLMVESQ